MSLIRVCFFDIGDLASFWILFFLCSMFILTNFGNVNVAQILGFILGTILTTSTVSKNCSGYLDKEKSFMEWVNSITTCRHTGRNINYGKSFLLNLLHLMSFYLVTYLHLTNGHQLELLRAQIIPTYLPSRGSPQPIKDTSLHFKYLLSTESLDVQQQ